MTKKQRAEAITEFLVPIIREAAVVINESEDDSERQNNLARVYVLTEILKDLNDGQKN
tara:strand:+ start:858 stop:1031 length:174 start_codon:yes stop_codon:yes gene_type:complete